MIKHFTDLRVWQAGQKLAEDVYAFSKVGSFAKDFALRDQIRRAMISVVSNIAEGFGRGGNAEFVQFLWTAKGSAAEVGAQLYLAKSQAYITDDAFNQLKEQVAHIDKLLGAFIRYLKKSSIKGEKYKNRQTANRKREPKPNDDAAFC